MLRHVAILLLGFVSTVQGATVVVNDNIEIEYNPAAYPGAVALFDVWKTIPHYPIGDDNCVDTGCTTGAAVRYASEILRITPVTLEEQSDWYVVEPGDVFSAATINAGHFPVLFDRNFPNQIIGEVAVGPGDFYLGVRTGRGWEVFPGPPRRDIYGWVKMHSENGVLTMLENVLAYQTTGIIVGTTTVVPEPTTFAMIALGISCFAARGVRRRLSQSEAA